MNLVCYTRPDGGIDIVSFKANAGPSLGAVPPSATNVRIISDTDLPSDRYFRNAWRDSGATITIDMPTARNIHRANLLARAADFRERYHRLVRLRQLRGDNTGAADAGRKRDAIDVINYILLHTQIEAAATPAALRAVMPAELADEPPITGITGRS